MLISKKGNIAEYNKQTLCYLTPNLTYSYTFLLKMDSNNQEVLMSKLGLVIRLSCHLYNNMEEVCTFFTDRPHLKATLNSFDNVFKVFIGVTLLFLAALTSGQARASQV